jgi:hypothetical protein
MGQSFVRGELIKLGLIVLFISLMLAVGATFYYVDKREAQLKRIASQEDVKAFEAEGALVKVKQNPVKVKQNPVKAFFETYLDQTRFDKVDSIRAVGVYKADGTEMELTFLIL